MSERSIRAAIEAARKKTKFPALALTKRKADDAAIFSKLVRGQTQPTYDNENNRTIAAPNVSVLKEKSANINQNITDTQTVLQVLPDITLAIQIVISSILSPKDMITSELLFTPPPDMVSSELGAAMIDRVRIYFETDYRIKPLLPMMLNDVLFETGSYPVVVIPENSVDEVINGKQTLSLENLTDSFNKKDGMPINTGVLLGPPDGETKEVNVVSQEAFGAVIPNRGYETRIMMKYGEAGTQAVDTQVRVTDNMDVLKLPKMAERLRSQRVREVLGRRNTAMAMESNNEAYNDRELSALLFKDRHQTYRPITALKTQDQLNRYTVGEPLILKLPSESVIPVYIPGSEERHIGYFVLIDANGNPVSRNGSPDFYREFGSRMNAGGSFPTAMLNKTGMQMYGRECTDQKYMDYAARTYGDMIEADILARLRNGVYKHSLAIAKKDEIYRIMLARSLAKQTTQLLWVPIELMTYMAFKYNQDGIGKSLMDDMKILNSLRSMLTFASVMAAVKNSIGRTEVKLKLDEKDPNPQKTIELLVTEIARTRQQAFPVGTQNPVDLVEWMGRAGFEFTFEGHPGLPDVQVDFGEKNSNYVKPDQELMDDLRKQSYMAFGLTPEMVDAAYQPETATSVVANNVLFAKRVTQYQDMFTPFLTDHCRKVMLNSQNIYNDLCNILRESFDKIILTDSIRAIAKKQPRIEEDIIRTIAEDFILGVDVALPRPDSVSMETQLKALEVHEATLEKGLDQYVNSAFFTQDLGGTVANQVEPLRAMAKAYFMRKFMLENGILPELADLTIENDDGRASIDLYKEQENLLKGLIKSFSKFMANIYPTKTAADQVMDALGAGGDSFGGGGGFDDNSGGDNFGGGDDSFNIDSADDVTPEEPGNDPDNASETTEEKEFTKDGETITKTITSSSGTDLGL